MSNNRRSIPSVPRGIPAEQRRFFESLRENMQTIADKGRGDSKDAAITWRDWQKANGTKSLSVLQVMDDASSSELYGDARPNKPTSVEILPTFESVLCTWGKVSAKWYASTQIYRSVWDEDTDRPVFANAIQVGAVATPFFTDYLPPGTRAVYWIRHINRDNQAGPTHDIDGTEVTLYSRPIDVLEEYSQDIYDSDNYKWLRSSVGMMDAINRAYEMAGLSSDSTLAQMIGSASSVDDLLADMALSAALSKQTQTWSAQAQLSRNYARLSGGVNAAVSLTDAYVSRIQTLESNWGELDTTINSKIEEFSTAFTSEAGALATYMSEYTVTYGETTVSLEALSLAVANNNDEYVAQWGVKTAIGDVQGGVGFYNDGVTTSFIVDADVFTVTGGSTNLLPFVIKDGLVVMQESLIDTAEIYTLISQNITAQNIAATVSLTSPEIVGGSIDGTTLNINDEFYVTSTGYMFAANADIEGTVRATDGYLDNVTIRASCDILGTLTANSIEGDVVDRMVIALNDDTTISNTSELTVFSADIIPGIVGPDNDRSVVVSGFRMHLYSSGRDASSVALVLYLDGVEQQRFEIAIDTYSIGETEESTPTLACVIPEGNINHNITVRMESTSADQATLKAGCGVMDIYKSGSSVANATGPTLDSGNFFSSTTLPDYEIF